jgi:DHA2 family multidrug resistance protein
MAAPAAPQLNRPMIALVTGLSTIIVMLDMTVVNVALPKLEGALNSTREQSAWVLTAYVIAMAIATPLTGWLAERIGRRALFVLAIAGFTGASAACGLATSMPELVSYRVLQGAFAASIAPLSQALLLDANPPERHGRAMAVFAMASMLGPTLGPPLGGWLSDHYSWRWCFFINLPLGFAMAAGAWIYVRDADRSATRRLDVFGYLALALGVACFQLVLDRGPGREWFASGEIWIWAGLSALGFYWFVVQSLTTDRPLFALDLAKDLNWVSAAALAFLISMVLFSAVTLAPPILQGVLGYPAFESGLTVLPRGAGTIASTFIVGRLMGRIDGRLIILVGIVLTAAGFVAMGGISPAGDNRLIMLASAIQGVGQGTFFVPVSTIAFATLAPRLRTDAAAAMGVIRNMGTSMGVSLVVAMQSANEMAARAALGAHLGEDVLAARTAEAASAELAVLARELARQADLVAYVNTFYFMAALCLLPLPVLLLLRLRGRG